MSLEKSDLQHLLNQAKTKLVGASEAAMKAELYDVLNEFFNGSNAWQEAIPVPIIPDETVYDIVPSQGGQIIRLVGVLDVNGFPQSAVMAQFGTLTFANPYNQAQTFQAVVAKNVTRPVGKDFVPDAPSFALSIYGTTILAGLLGRMMLQPNKSYFNESLGQYHTKDFNDGIAAARIATIRANSMGTQRWGFPRFGAGSQRGGVSTANPNRF